MVTMELLKRLSQYGRSAGAFVSSVESSHPLVSATLRKVGLSRPFKPTPAAVKAYGAVIAEKVGLIDRLPAKYRQEAYALIWSHVMKGYDASGLARELPDRLGIAQDRAKLIARSQCNMARAVIENTERMEMGIRECKSTRAGKRTVSAILSLSTARHPGIDAGIEDPPA